MASQRNGTIYVGVTSDLIGRTWQHREGMIAGFTKRHGCKMLVWFERGDTMDGAILREKQLKGGSRAKKLALIEAANRNGVTSTRRLSVADSLNAPVLASAAKQSRLSRAALDCFATLAMTLEGSR